MTDREFHKIKSYAVIGYAMMEKGYTEKTFLTITDKELRELINEFDKFIERLVFE